MKTSNRSRGGEVDELGSKCPKCSREISPEGADLEDFGEEGEPGTYRPEIVAKLKDLLLRQSVEGDHVETEAERGTLDEIGEPESREADWWFLRVCDLAQEVGIDVLSESELAEIHTDIAQRSWLAGMVEDGRLVERQGADGTFHFRGRRPWHKRKYGRKFDA